MAKAAPINKLTKPGHLLFDSASVLIVRWHELMAWAEAAHDPENVTELHNMRIAAKRLRYTLEIFAPVLRSESTVFPSITELQERIGAIHDCDVLFPLLRKTLEAEIKREGKSNAAGPPPFLAAEGLVALLTRKREERRALYNDFIQWWDALPPHKLAEDLEQLIASQPNTAEAAQTNEELPNVPNES